MFRVFTLLLLWCFVPAAEMSPTVQLQPAPRYKLLALEPVISERIETIPSYRLPTKGSVISPFGKRGRRRHTGIDITARKGSPIRVVANGVVTGSGYSQGYGYMVAVNHGMYVTRYAHCSVLKAKVGVKVRMGEIVGLVGSTGRATGSHLHFEIMRNGKFLNPADYLILDVNS